MKKMIMTSLLFAAFLLTLAASTSAQRSPERTRSLIDNLRSELEHTSELIERAKEAVRSSGNPVSRLALEQAIKLQHMAWDAFRMGTEIGYKEAAGLTRRARELASQAIASARQAEEGEEVVLRKLERAKALMERVHEAISGQAYPRLRELFEAARASLHRAWEFYRDHRYRPALKLCNQVEKIARDILESSQRDSRQISHFERRAEKVREQLERYRQLVAECGSESAMRMLQQATEAFHKARETAASGRMASAQAALQKAHQLANHAADQCRNQSNLQQRLERLLNQAEQIGERIPPGDENGRKLLQRSLEQLDRARSLIHSNESEAAAAALKAAQLTLGRLKRILEQSHGGF